MSNADLAKQGHPRGLYILFFSEMWERFCYYGMRTLLTLYLVKALFKGDADAALIYGAYTGLVYAAPVLGGRMADQFLGYRFAIILGAILMSIGEFLILGGTESWLFLGMGAIIIGNGYFKANISTIVGKLYKENDPRRDSGFTIFYIGINVGALLATSVVAYVGETYGFKYGFGLAGIGMLLGMLIFWFGRDRYAEAEGLDITPAGKKKIVGPINYVFLITLISIALVPVCYVLISKNEILQYLLLGLFVLVSYNLISSGAKEGKVWRDRMIALVIFILINIVFWAFFEQAGTSLTLFADRNVDREIFGWVMPASMTQFFNPFFIVVFGSIFSVMWVKLSEMGKNPSIPMKFAFGILQLGLGFLVTLLGLTFADGFQVPLLTLVFLYLLHTTGELFLSPIGLSMVTKLAPSKISGTAMGGWFLSFAIGNFLGGQIATLTGTHGSEEGPQLEFPMTTTVMQASDDVASINFTDWKSLTEEMPVNITVGKYMDIQDWVEFRLAFAGDMNFVDWKTQRSLNSPFTSAQDWLNKEQWNKLGSTYDSILKADKELLEQDPKANVINIETWLYFREAIEEMEGAGLSLPDAYKQHKMERMEIGLNKYTDVFSNIGFILIGFSVVIMIFNKPLKKLMHGVE
ncbi:peptide MFS transporter [Croceimicrobium hydrocarbonivorans]|uniref:Peptide MFS transporter n=1 Tax=Croceimicrobium hydrocarbonivorans TaxID=2761580 RepID=A0A7H0VC27_9FLAO|nr:peptide MFS transporter [Croceimicrobium hydrocarbonivorans]QNR23275.1 peptide MFS transporter [Croceimicrobium hydrocarbonivorans]